MLEGGSRPLRVSGLFASRQFLIGRFCLSSLVALTLIVLGHGALATVWFLAHAMSLGGQIAINRCWSAMAERKSRVWGPVRAGLSILDTSLYAFAAALMRMTPSPITTEFSLIVLMITVLYCLMYFYMQPRLLLVMALPCLISLACSDLLEMRAANAAGFSALSIIPVLGSILVVYFLFQTRKQLARARSRLVQARLDAQNREDDARRASQAKSDFLATMGHEIRTPLNGVLGIAQIMARDQMSDIQRSRLDIVSKSGEALLAILNDLLDFSKIEAGKFELEFSSFSLEALVKGVQTTFASAAELKDLSFNLTIAPEASGIYRGDSARLRQILHNLISNGVKFTERGSVSVAVLYEGGWLNATVVDTGIGIAPNRLPALCEKFVQADSSTTRKYGGTGLGLAIVRNLAELMGGHLDIVSELGLGSTFTLSVPLERLSACEEGTIEVAAPYATIDDDETGVLRVLAADDNPTNQIVLRSMLQQAGIDITLVENGHEAVQAWQAARWDVILMDVQMPVMDGLAATREIRLMELQTGRIRTPIVALTANTMIHQQAEYLATGMDGFISKPIDARLLFETLQTILSGAEKPNAEVLDFDMCLT